MRYLHLLVLVCAFWVHPAQALILDDFIKQIKTPETEQILTPATTQELQKLFSNASSSTIPRVFIDKLPADFAVNGDQTLYAQVLAALILRENEKSIRDKLVIALLKQKYDQKEPWTEMEQAFFNELVDKYDVVAKKTIPTQLEQLMLKADEVPVGMAIAQSVYDTNWGKKQMESPYGQMGWIDDNNYVKLKFDSLVKATESYVREMNSTPNYFMWRLQRDAANYKGYARKRSYNFALALRVYRPEDPVYPTEIRKLILSNPFLSQMDNISFIQEAKQ